MGLGDGRSEPEEIEYHNPGFDVDDDIQAVEIDVDEALRAVIVGSEGRGKWVDDQHVDMNQVVLRSGHERRRAAAPRRRRRGRHRVLPGDVPVNLFVRWY